MCRLLRTLLLLYPMKGLLNQVRLLKRKVVAGYKVNNSILLNYKNTLVFRSHHWNSSSHFLVFYFLLISGLRTVQLPLLSLFHFELLKLLLERAYLCCAGILNSCSERKVRYYYCRHISSFLLLRELYAKSHYFFD